ncbi:hypothetical protein H9P43_008855 [Blastocladiella emersonii ATCC 22665]|nr:hypothetical protein H9P43_008855 [Blastocladiella emersonii ATCC 22665]
MENTGRCVDFSEATANGVSAKAQLWACSQVWGKDSADTPHAHKFLDPNKDMTVVHEYGGVEYCLDVAEGKAFAGADVRWWKCNGTPAQKWNKWDGHVRSKLNNNLCLDPDQGFNNDWNGQRLQLWHCHGGGEQVFGIDPKVYTNGMFDMRRECKAQRGYKQTCTFTCAYREQWKRFWYDGVTYSCGYPDGREDPVCLSQLDSTVYPHDSSPEDGDLCWCECRTIGAPTESVGAPRNRTAPTSPAVTRVSLPSAKRATKTAAGVSAATAVPTLGAHGRQ